MSGFIFPHKIKLSSYRKKEKKEKETIIKGDVVDVDYNILDSA